jgi:hypothetical protein
MASRRTRCVVEVDIELRNGLEGSYSWESQASTPARLAHKSIAWARDEMRKAGHRGASAPISRVKIVAYVEEG